MRHRSTHLGRDTRGVTSVEYAVIAGVIVVAIVLAVTTMGSNVSGFFVKANSPFTTSK